MLLFPVGHFTIKRGTSLNPCRIRHTIIFIVLISIYASWSAPGGDLQSWSRDEIDMLRSLWIGSLEAPPLDPTNVYSGNEKAARLGKKLFFDTRFSGNRKVSCGTCHNPGYSFTDRTPLAHGMGKGTRRTMTLIGVAFNPRFFWDGRKDSLWSQALGPIESEREHGFSRTRSVLTLLKFYRKEYEEVFGKAPPIDVENIPPGARPWGDNPAGLKSWALLGIEVQEKVNRIYVNMGKAIASYVRTIQPGPAPFDRYVEALIMGDTKGMQESMSQRAVAGLKLFIGKAQCVNCHNGPLFTNWDFHNLGLPPGIGLHPDEGRARGIREVLQDEFNCFGRFSDGDENRCAEIRYMDTSTDRFVGSFKTPTLRNVSKRAPFMHDGRFSSIRRLLEFYRSSKSTELHHGNLSDRELEEIESFLEALSGPVKSL